VTVPEWGTSDRVFYCRIHDSLIRSAAAEVGFQCDWAQAVQIPLFYETCTREIAYLKADVPSDA